MDMSEKLWQVYNRLDPVSLENLLAEVKTSSVTKNPFQMNRINQNVFIELGAAVGLSQMINVLKRSHEVLSSDPCGSCSSSGPGVF